MDKELRILILEDVAADAALVKHELRKAGLVFASKIVDTREAFLKALEEFLPDLILSDYKLPSFDGIAALGIAHEKCPDVPFILITGELGEEIAIETLKKGATDYVLKGNLKRLVPSVKRALEEAEERTERKRSEEVLKEEMLRRSILMDRSLDGIAILNQDHELVEANQRFAEMLGYTPKELIGMHPWDWQAVMTEEEIRTKFEDLTKINVVFETRHRRKDGTILDVEVSASGTKVGDEPMVFSVYRDITERKRAEKALRFSETRFRSLAEESPNMIFINYKGRVVYANKKCEEIMGYTRDDFYREKFDFRSLIAPEYLDLVSSSFQKHMQGEEVLPYEYAILTKDGKRLEVIITTKLIDYENDKAILGIITDITEHNQSEQVLKETEQKLRNIVEHSNEIYYIHGTNQVLSYVSPQSLQILGYTPDEIRIEWTKLVTDNPINEEGGEITEKALKTGEKQPPYFLELYKKDRSKVLLEIDESPLKDGQGNVIGIAGAARDVTEQKKSEDKLRDSERRLASASSVAHVGHWDRNEQTGDLIWTDEVYRIFGYEPGEIVPSIEIFISHIHLEDREKVQKAIKASASKPIPYNVEFRFRRKDGMECVGLATGGAEFDQDGRAIRMSGAMQDITEIRRAEDALQASEAELHDNYFIQATINMILSESLENIPLEEILQKSLNMILAIPWIAFESIGSIFLLEDDEDVLVMKAQSNLPEPLKKLCVRVPFGKCLCGKAAKTQNIVFAEHIDEQHEICYEGIYPHGHYSVPILFGGKTLGVLNIYLKEGHIRDKKEEDFLQTVADTLAGIIMRKKAEERIEYLAYYDALTGLPNRNLFIDRLKQGVARSEHTSKIVAVLITDINRFKFINDTYGTEIGDRVLNEVAERLSTAVRKGDTIARLGNDEFGIALLDIANLDDVIPVLEKIMTYISYPLEIDSNEIALTFSTGISIYPHDNKNPQDLLKSAGLALGIAKKAGRKTYQFFSEDFNVKASEFVLMEKNLYRAIKNEEFVLHYQPYWDINAQKMVGMEALIRWQSKDVGLVLPGKFIPVLEDTGMIIEVGEWILREAMRQVKEWQNNGYPVVPVSVNMSLVQFRQKDLAKMVKRLMAECGFYPSLLTLEITESAFMQDIEFTKSVLTTMKDLGCSISIDDFGTGYSSLSYLKRFPVDNLKIDISFIREMAKDPDSASIVMAIINMAHTLNLKTIAEGIETEEQWNFLRLLRCDMGQGFYLSKPLPAEDVEKLLI